MGARPHKSGTGHRMTDDERRELRRVGRQLAAARERLEAAMSAAEATADDAYHEGVPEAEIARLLGVNRMTVRKWLGKL